MQFRNVCLEAFGYRLPDEIVTSSDIEARLEPLYTRLRLPEGRLELMTGIRERRIWPVGTAPSTISIESANLAIENAGIDRREIGLLIHASVCRDHLEPATACSVHHGLRLRSDCWVYDVSNACLGLLNGLSQAAVMIESGAIRAAVVVGTESSRDLLETTIAHLNRDTSITRQQMKLALASLTIGSGSCAMVLCHRDITRTGNAVRAVAARAHTEHHQLCQSGRDEAAVGGMQPLMQTDSDTLLREGLVAGIATFKAFLEETGWSPSEMDRTFCHQVTATHRQMMLESLGLPEGRDMATFDWLGNTGSVALPTAMAIGLERGFVRSGENVAMLGIGSGINCLMAGVEWQTTLASGHNVHSKPETVAGS